MCKQKISDKKYKNGVSGQCKQHYILSAKERERYENQHSLQGY